MNFNPALQQQINQAINTELGKCVVSWTADLREWYPIALDALNHASVASLNIAGTSYSKMFEQEKQGLNAIVVATLSNHLEKVTPDQMGYTTGEWVAVIELNMRVAEHWESFCGPIRDRVGKQFEDKAKPRILTMDAVRD